MSIKNEKGVTMVMLVITIIVMLILASVITYFTVKDNHLLKNSENLKVIEEVQAIKDKINEDETTKQVLTGDINAVLTTSDINLILGDYRGALKVVVEDDTSTGGKKSVLYYVNESGKFTPEQKKELETKLGINGK